MTRSISRSAARLAAVQALYQQEMEGTPTTRLIHEFHAHRLGATIGDVTYADAEESFFDDLVTGTAARQAEIAVRLQAAANRVTLYRVLGGDQATATPAASAGPAAR